MSAENGGKSLYGDAEARRQSVLDAAAELLDEGGYAALTNRAVAKRAGMSPGLIYQYFVDKQDIFITLLHESQLGLIEFIRDLPRDKGVAAVLTAIVPESTHQWKRVGHLVGSWRNFDGTFERSSSFWKLNESTEMQFAELRRALVEAAESEGRHLRDNPALVHYVWSGLMGLADTLANNWTQGIVEQDALIAFATDSLARAITE